MHVARTPPFPLRPGEPIRHRQAASVFTVINNRETKRAGPSVLATSATRRCNRELRLLLRRRLGRPVHEIAVGFLEVIVLAAVILLIWPDAVEGERRAVVGTAIDQRLAAE